MTQAGVVLNKPLGISETFIERELRILEIQGYHILVFLHQVEDRNKLKGNFKVIDPWPSFKSKTYKFFFLIYKIIVFFSSRPFIAFKFLKTELATSDLQLTLKHFYFSGPILQQKPDLLIFTYGFLGLNREKIGKALHCKVITIFRGSDWWIYPLNNTGIYNEVALESDHLVVGSEAMKGSMLSQFHCESSKILVIPGILQYPKKLPLRRGGKKQVLHLLIAARLHWVKGFHDLFEALHYLKTDADFDLHLTVVGDGEGEEKERYQFHVYQRGLKDIVSFKGALPHEDVLKLMPEFDLLVQPSYSEGMPNTIMEAMVRKLPVLTTEWPGVEEIIEHECNGLISPFCAPQELACLIEKYFHYSLQEKQRIESNARKTILQHFNPTVNQKRFSELIRLN